MTDPPLKTRAARRPRVKRLIIRVTDAELVRLDALADREQRTRSDMARILINRGTEKR